MSSVIRGRFGGAVLNFAKCFRSPFAERMRLHTSLFLNAEGQEIKMPSLSPTMTDGTIVKWLKKEGDAIAAGDVLCEIQTDKAVMSFETEEEGILAKILVREDTKDVKVGTVIALMVAEGEDWKSVELPSGESAEAEQKPTSAFKPKSGGNVPGVSITMPSLSPTMTEGTIVKWHKKEGDTISPGDVLCDIQTDKAVMSFETEEEGILAKILVPEGTAEVKVGTLIAMMVTEGEDWQQVAIPGEEAEQEESLALATGGSVEGMSITMPSLSPTMTEGTIVKWHKKEGDPVAPGDVLCDIQTDKAVMSFETEEEGILAKILVPEGTAEVKVGTLIALMVAEGEDWKDVAIPGARPAASPKVEKAEPPAVHTHAEPQNYGPAVRGLLELYQIQKDKITPSGRNNKLLKSDVLRYITEHKLQPKPPRSVPPPKIKSAEAVKPSTAAVSALATQQRRAAAGEKYVDIEVSSMRRTIAKRLTESKVCIPHAYATVESDIDLVLSLRKQLKSVGVVVSVNDFVVKAVALALRNCPMVNCLYINDEVVLSPTVDISVAVATESGLITPIVKCADGKSVDDISAEIKELAGRARQGKLQLHEFQGGSFTISNLGMYGISEFSAIINPPQCAILAVGSGRPTVDINGQIVTKMTAMLSYDGRAISDSAAADFLETVQYLLQNPASVVMGVVPNRKIKTAV